MDVLQVGVHTDVAAADSARALGASAYAVGDRIVFGSNRLDAGTPEGRRLLVHELMHVRQAGSRARSIREAFATQRGDGPSGASLVSSPSDAAEMDADRASRAVALSGGTLAPGSPTGARAHAVVHRDTGRTTAIHGSEPFAAEKSSEQLEGMYRRLGDTRRANAIRLCRTQGGGACNLVLTQREVSSLYALGHDAKGDRKAVVSGLSSAAPALVALSEAGGGVTGASVTTGAAASGLTLVPGTGSGVVAAATGGPTATLTLVGGSTSVATGAAGSTVTAGAGAATGVGVGAVATAGVLAVIGICVIAGVQLWEMARFQAELEAEGFIILDDALQICIRGCHTGSGSPRTDGEGWKELPAPDFDPTRWFPQSTARPSTDRGPTARPRLEPRPVPRPFPDSDVDEEQRKGCRGMATFQRGGNSCHDRFATSISGVAREWMVVTPEGLTETFDARSQDGVTLWETKTGYAWINRPTLSPLQQRLRSKALDTWPKQAAHQQMVADRCGYTLRWAFTSEEARRFADPLVQAPTTTFSFSCNEDGERGA